MKPSIIYAGLVISSMMGCTKPAKDCIDESKINKNAICYEIYAPVCGCDGQTYSNDCRAKNAGVTSWTEGACGKK